MILDSNIIIYAVQPQFDTLNHFILENEVVVSAISYLEVMGFHRLDPVEKAKLEVFFSGMTILPLEQKVVQCAVLLRQQRKMSLGDALIAATALEYERTLVTRNVKDFEWIDGLAVLNPIQTLESP